jgi:ribosome biogenesis protein ENP2
MKLELYDTARAIANPFAYEEYREKKVRERVEKMAEERIRAKEVGVKVNKTLAEKIRREEEMERKKEKRKEAKRAEMVAAMKVDGEPDRSEIAKEKRSLLNDPRFKKLFEDPDFAVDERSREFALMNPSAVAQRGHGNDARNARRTAVEDEEEESDKISTDGLEEGSSGSGTDENGSDSSDAGSERGFLSMFDC